jgi:hypothetical protein
MGADDFEEEEGEDAEGQMMRQEIEEEGAEQERVGEERMELLEGLIGILEGAGDIGHL